MRTKEQERCRDCETTVLYTKSYVIERSHRGWHREKTKTCIKGQTRTLPCPSMMCPDYRSCCMAISEDCMPLIPKARPEGRAAVSHDGALYL